MREYIVPDVNAENHTAELQRAANDARDKGGIIAVRGKWNLCDTVYIHENTCVIFEDAEVMGKCDVLFKNSVVLSPRKQTKLGCQSGISLIGKNSVLYGTTELFNVRTFNIEGLRCENVSVGIALMYAYGGNLKNLSFVNADSCIKCLIGTRNCFFTDISSENCGEYICFDSNRLPDDVRVNYAGPDVKNNIVRGACGEVLKRGDYCSDIVVMK